MFAAIQLLQSLTLPIHGTVAEPFPNAVGAQAGASDEQDWMVTYTDLVTLLLTLFVIYNMVQIGANRLVSTLLPGSSIEIGGFTSGVIALAVVFGAFSSEVFLGAIRAIPKGQGEAGRSLGLSPAKSFALITLPQLWRLALPGLGNLWLVLIKDTSLVSVIALNDLLRQTQVAVGVTKEPFFFYLVACLIYLAFTLVSSAGFNRLEARANRGFEAR